MIPPIYIVMGAETDEAETVLLLERPSPLSSNILLSKQGKFWNKEFLQANRFVARQGLFIVDKSNADEGPRILSQRELIGNLLGGSDRSQVIQDALFVLPATDGSFNWPGTFIKPNQGSGKPLNIRDSPEMGLLRSMGYRVGRNGLGPNQRRRILARAYFIENPPFIHSQSDSYREEWGPAQTASRLKKIAYSIASFCRMKKRRIDFHKSAIHAWEDDLAWLKKEFYDDVYDLPKYQFEWPNTSCSGEDLEEGGTQQKLF